jgi:hypothetical protein
MAMAVLAIPMSWLLRIPLLTFASHGSETSPDGGGIAWWGFALHWPLVLLGILGVSGLALFLSRKHVDTSA